MFFVVVLLILFIAVMSGLWNYTKNLLVDYIDIDTTLWILTPFLVTFLLPLVIVLLFYITALVLYIYRLHRHRLRNAYGTDWKSAARSVVAAIWDAHGWIWHGYELVGVDNIPDDQPVLFVYYHGAIPVDLYYFISKVFLFKSKLIHTVADRFLFKIPGWTIISNVIKVIPGTVETCAEILREGNYLAISPGGVYEAQFGDAYYELMWKNRLGFAKVALDAKVAIVPVFTKNIREAFRTLSWGKRFWLWLYEKTKFPFVPLYGGFPVKLKTYIGKPIPYDGTLSAEELQIKIAKELTNLIHQHQDIPGSVIRALLERICDFDKKVG